MGDTDDNEWYILPYGSALEEYSDDKRRTGYSEITKIETKLPACNHTFINVGFHFDKYVCKICNKDQT